MAPPGERRRGAARPRRASALRLERVHQDGLPLSLEQSAPALVLPERHQVSRLVLTPCKVKTLLGALETMAQQILQQQATA